VVPLFAKNVTCPLGATNAAPELLVTTAVKVVVPEAAMDVGLAETTTDTAVVVLVPPPPLMLLPHPAARRQSGRAEMSNRRREKRALIAEFIGMSVRRSMLLISCSRRRAEGILWANSSSPARKSHKQSGEGGKISVENWDVTVD
jgi:hypothetical protein